ncbi:MAG TPA: hypothetical protein PLY97_11035 [Acidocella sp.]|nr:hypothetical protein [Acidocella sp.]
MAFLNGLVSNDVTRAAPGTAVWAALLTPQGRYLCDFFIFAEAGRLLLDAPHVLVEGVLTKLRRMKLRADVAIEDVSAEVAVYAGWGGATPTLALCAPDHG